jgi:predicted MPP superfamily phosphohydrolase
VNPLLLPLLNTVDAVLLAGGIACAWRLRWRGSPREVGFGLIFGAVALGTHWVAVTSLTPDRFAVLRGICHALFCVFLPVLFVRALRGRRHAPRTCLLTVLLTVFGEGCYVWAREVEPFRLEITRERITSARLLDLEKPVRLAVVSDLQPESIGAYEISIFDTLVAERPDLIVFLGDYIQAGDESFLLQRDLLRAQLARLSPPLGMYAVDGDVDWRGAEVVFAGTAVQVLVDDHAALAGVPIDLIGLSRARGRRHALDVGLVQRLRGERFPIVLAHAPDYMRCVLDGGFRAEALFLAGHTHGGQVQVPGFGPLITLSSVPRWLAGGGVFRSGDTWLAVSRGIGMERDQAPRIRFWCRPQLLLLELAAQ